MILLKKAMNENTQIHDDVIFLQSFKVKSLQFFFEIFLFEIFDKKKFFFDLTSFFDDRKTRPKTLSTFVAMNLRLQNCN